MLHGNVHVPFKNVETNPHISSSKIIDTAKFCSSGQVSNSDYAIDLHINYEQVPKKDAKLKDQPISLNLIYNWKLTISLSLTKRKIIKMLIFNKRIYLKRIIYRMVKVV